MIKRMIILLHSSKTMHSRPDPTAYYQKPALLADAKILATYLKSLSVEKIQKAMAVSPKLSEQTQSLIQEWNTDPADQTPAIDSFAGDIYSGLQTHTWSNNDRTYANQVLRILSGLYGILRPLDMIHPYRLEMGYRLPDSQFNNLYDFWEEKISKTIAPNQPIVNLSAVEYSRVITKYVDPARVITPKFLTQNGETSEPAFVVVHAKIARGAFAGWIIKNRLTDTNQLHNFKEIGYNYSATQSTPNEPVFICNQFRGLGLSVRLRQ